jgi:hypothetical protein
VELSLARLIHQIANDPHAPGRLAWDVDMALASCGVAPTEENRTALAAAFDLLRRQHNSAGTDAYLALDPPAPGWDGGPIIPFAAPQRA